jgi:aryl-alcohol dehydrogenase-like predicted oxidoreductase
MRHNQLLVLGGAQFGSNYGLSKSVLFKKKELKFILNYAFKLGFKEFDSAINYNLPTSVYVELQKIGYKISSKLPYMNEKNPIKLKSMIFRTINNYMKIKKIKKIFNFYIHDTKELKDKKKFKKIFQVLKKIKNRGKICNISVSTYSPNDVRNVIKFSSSDKPYAIQFPFNYLDRRMDESGLLKKLKKINIKTYARSIYLQGVLLMSKKKRPPYFYKFKNIFTKWDRICNFDCKQRIRACVTLIKNNKNIDKIIVGFDNLQNIKDFIYYFKSKSNFKNSEVFNKNSVQLIDPRKWKIN